MSETAPMERQGSNGHRRSANMIILIVGLSLVALVTLAGLLFAANFRGGTVDQSDDLAAGSSVSVEIPNAALTLRPSDDDEIHVTVRGTYLGEQPRLETGTSGGVTTISGGCPRRWFSFCSVDVTVEIPESLPLTVEGQNGAITATGLTGRLSLGTTNGRIETDGSEGDIDLRTTNGAIRVQGATSANVTATTTNGNVDLGFVGPPTDVVARSTNGAVTVRVPVDGLTYFVTARTTNGSTNTDSVPTDRTSNRTITAETTNGSVNVVPN